MKSTGHVYSGSISIRQTEDSDLRLLNAFRRTIELHDGVPQGSVISPILFDLFIQPPSKLLKRHSLSVH